MNSLFPSSPIVFDWPDSEISYLPNFISPEESQLIFEELMKSINWKQDDIKVFGKIYPQPRLTALYGDSEKSYSYSNLTLHPNEWTPLLLKLKEKVETSSQTEFTTVLLNLYRDGQDSNGWHADNEKELGENPIIASMSFGAERYFHLKHNTIKEHSHKILLENGSLLLMKGTTQHFWKHQIPKTRKPLEPRINLTFRTLKQS